MYFYLVTSTDILQYPIIYKDPGLILMESVNDKIVLTKAQLKTYIKMEKNKVSKALL